MEDDGSADKNTKLTEMVRVDLIQPSVSGILKPSKTDWCMKNQADVSMTKEASQPVAPLPVRSSKSSTLSSCASSDITATLENESVWSRFHSLGTEMILTTQGRRMFPCCRFRLSGLDPERKYLLIMDVVPLDNFIHKWNGKAWEPAAMGQPAVPGRMCVHPESPALGTRWMENPVSFYKVKLSHDSMDEEGCLVLRPMHHYQPRLHIVPAESGSEEPVSLDSHDVKTFTFPKTEFYAVTSYQNPQITQLKIDCNPFAMAFREDSQSIRLLQDKLRLCSPVGPRSHPAVLSLNRATREQMSTLKNAASPSIKDSSIKSSYPESPSTQRGEGIVTKIRNASRCTNSVALCKEDVVKGRGKGIVKQYPMESVLDDNVAPLVVESNETVSSEQPPQTTDTPVPAVSTTESLEFASKDIVRSEMSSAHRSSPPKSFATAQVPQSQEKVKLKPATVPLVKPHFLTSSQVNKHSTRPCFIRRRYRRRRKAKAKRWSTVRSSRALPPVVTALDISLQPDLEDVEGVLFVSFAAKEALNIHVQNMKPVEPSPHPQSQTRSQFDSHEMKDVNLSMEERLLMLESTLLLHLKHQKHRQVIHPVLQEVGLKLGLLDPLVGIDLRYLGVQLPLPPPVYSGLDKANSMSLASSCDAAGSFVSRTGKTNDPTKIKGWRDKFTTTTGQGAPEGLRSTSAFCSDMLDEYLRNEAQQITDRAAVFSKTSTLPVSYQLPSKSSSYVVTLDSLLRNRSGQPNKTPRNAPNKTLPTSSFSGSPGNSIPLFSTGSQHKMLGKGGKCSHFDHSLQGRPHVMSPAQVTCSTGDPSTPVMKRKRGRPPLRASSSRGADSQSTAGRHAATPAKTQVQIRLQSMEEEAFSLGNVRTHITSRRATFALNSLLTSQRSVRRTKFSTFYHNQVACPEDFCRLGCICDSLHREIRGPIHCRRVECMFDCNCFKHKVFLVRPPRVTNVRQGKKNALMAFPITDLEKEPRPPPALSVTTLWKRRNPEHDPEPLFVPELAPCLKTAPRLRVYVPRPTPQIRDEDKDPVYLYFESMMTCARVREYNSNPPPQVHMLPSKRKMQAAIKTNHSFEGSLSPTSEESTEFLLTTEATKLPGALAVAVEPGEPEPTKLLEILSKCNWEPHRNSVLSALFRRMSTSHLTEPFRLGMYRVQPLSTTMKRGETCSTVTYTVCISRAEEPKVTEDLQPAENTTKTSVSTASGSQTKKVSAELPSGSKSSLKKKQQAKMPVKRPSVPFPLLTRAASAGYLKAEKKKLGGSGLGLIKVNGKMYTRAKLLLGQMGALHPVNRFAAFVTGRLQPKRKVAADIPKHCSPKAPVEPNDLPEVMGISKQTHSDVVRPAPATKTAGSNHTAVSDIAKPVEHSASLKGNTLSTPLAPAPVKPPVVPDGSKFLLVPVASPGGAVAPSAEMTSSALLPPGQPVVLQPVPGMPGSNFFCQYNGQMIQLVPLAPGPVAPPKSCSHNEGTPPQIVQKPADTGLPKYTTPVQKRVKANPVAKLLPKPLPSIRPNVLSLSVMSGMNIVNGTQPSFPAKMGTVSFRLCLPSGESKCMQSDQSAKPPDPCNTASSTLLLPGGFTVINLPVGVHPPVPPTLPTDATSASSLAGELPQNNNSVEKPISQSCSPDTEQECQPSESCTSPLKLETEADILSNGNNAQTSASVSEDSHMEKSAESVGSNNAAVHDKYDWVPEGAERIIKSNDDSESKHGDLDDWPPKGAERVLWMDEDDSASEEENQDINKQLNKDLNTPVAGQAGAEANDLKLTTTGTINFDSSACDECPLEDKRSHEKTETSESPHTQGIGSLPETDDEQKNDKQKHLEISLPTNDQETVHNEPSINVSNSTHANNCVQRRTFDGSSPLIINEINNEPEQTLPFSPPDVSEQILVPQSGPPIPVKIEPYNEQMQKPRVANPSDIGEQGLVSEHSFPVINKIQSYSDQTQKNALSNHLDQSPESHSGVFIKIEPYNDPPQTDTCSSNSSITPDQMATVAPKHPDVSKGLGSEDYSQILSNEELHNDSPVQTELLVSTSPNIDAVEQSEDSDDDIDIDGDVPCPLLEGQTPAANATHSAHLPNVASSQTDPKMVSLHTVLQSSSGRNEVPHEFSKQSNACTRISGIAEHVHSKEVPEPKEHEIKNWNKRQFAMAVQGLRGDEEADLYLVTSSESDDEDLSNSSEVDSDVGGSSEEEDDDSSSDEGENSSDCESTTGSGTTEHSADLFSDDDDVDVGSFDEYQEKSINKMQNAALHTTDAMRAVQFREQVDQRTGIFNPMKILPARILAKRLNHTAKERARRGELQQSFASLKRELNVEEQIKMSKHDILIQARFMIRALEDRSRSLKEKRKAVLQKKSAYIRRIAELRGETEDTALMEPSEREKQLKIQTLALPSSQTNPQHLDSEGDPLLPHLGQWKATNYIQARSKKSNKKPTISTTVTVDDGSDTSLSSPVSSGVWDVGSPLPPTTTGDVILQRMAQNPNGLPAVNNSKILSAHHRPSANGPCTLPKIVLQSFGRTDVVVKLMSAKKAETGSSSRVCESIQSASLSENSNKEKQSSSLPDHERAIQNDTASEQGKDKNASENLVKVKKKRSKRDVVIEDALSNPESLGPRQLRNRSLAVSGIPTRSTPKKRRRRII